MDARNRRIRKPIAAEPEPAPRTPRYAEIYAALKDGIRAGRWPVGGKLPTEHELCAAFDASRHTVREAIRRLSEQGMIARKAGAGTTVLSKAGGGFTQQISALPDLLSYVRNARLEILDARDVRVDAAAARLVGGRRGQAWHRLTALKHLRGTRRPVAHLYAYVHREHPALFGVLDRRGVPLHDFIENSIGQRIVAVDQRFSARPIPAAEARALDVPAGTAGFAIDRRYRAEDGTAVLVTSTLFPHERMSYSMTLRLD